MPPATTRPRRGHARLAATALAGLGVCAACGTNSSSSGLPGSASGSSSTSWSGDLTVLAAASLTEAFDDAQAPLQQAHPGLSLTYSFAGSQQLVSQIQQGAPADVVATADTQSMQSLVVAQLVETPRVFARNLLEIAVAPGNPKHVSGLADLARSDLVVVLADTSVPAGKYGRQALSHAGVSVTPRSLELSVKAELTKVELGEADAAIVYVTDVTSAGAKVSGVAIPAADNVEASYPIAAVRASHNLAAARGFVDQAVSGLVQSALRKRGFLSP